jgi:hypothetical protein
VRSRLNTAAAVSGVRVVPPTILLGVGLANLDDLYAMYNEVSLTFAANMESQPWSLALPIVGIPLVARAMSTPPPRERSMQQLNYQACGPAPSHRPHRGPSPSA